MFIFTTKLTRKKIIAVVSAAAVLLCVLIIFAARGGDRKETAVSTVSYNNIQSNEDRVGFLKSFGWDVISEPLETQEVRIPTEFNEVYEKYNELQLAQGFDLTKYSGKRVKRYTYQITNYTGVDDEVIVTLLVYKSTVIGGDVMSTRLDGFMHGLTPDPNLNGKQDDEKDVGDAQTLGLSDVEMESDTVMDSLTDGLEVLGPDEAAQAK